MHIFVHTSHFSELCFGSLPKTTPHLKYAVLRQTLYNELQLHTLCGTKKDSHFLLSRPTQNSLD